MHGNGASDVRICLLPPRSICLKHCSAARLIQRHWRAHRLRRLRRQQSEGYAALSEAKGALGSLAVQHAELERRRAANLAFSGQTLVADSLGVLQEAVEGLLAAFLLPARGAAPTV